MGGLPTFANRFGQCVNAYLATPNAIVRGADVGRHTCRIGSARNRLLANTGGIKMSNWHANWAWSIPLIIINVVIHVLGLGIINERILQVLHGAIHARYFTGLFAVVMGVLALLATILHAMEGMVWAAAYRLLGALPDTHSAVLYSLSAVTTYGHANITLEPQWQLMGALEALNGILLFGLTTAFMFAMIQQIWPLGRRIHRNNTR
jgi:hypothetical protein